MKWLIQRFFLIFLSAWMLIGNSGISWTQETCLFTGHTKTSVDVTTKSGQSPKPHFSRASCYQYDHFQLKFGIDHVIQKKSSPAAEVILIHSFDPQISRNLQVYCPLVASHSIPHGFLPTSHIRRLAYLGVFQI